MIPLMDEADEMGLGASLGRLDTIATTTSSDQSDSVVYARIDKTLKRNRRLANDDEDGVTLMDNSVYDIL